MLKTKHKNIDIFKKGGFTIIEALVVLFIFSLITLTFYNVLSLGTRYIQNSRSRLGALSLANEKMEIVRNLKYDDIGIFKGDVSGNILHIENVVKGGKQYTVDTDISYIDDPMDGEFNADTIWWEDYKKVVITVFWGSGEANSEKVELVSRFVPPGLEVAHPGDGILSVSIFSDLEGGIGVSGANVYIRNQEAGLSTDRDTDSSGNVTFMGSNIKNAIQKYEITVTKNGYETVNTLPPYPITSYNPMDVHASVITGSLNVAFISQNKLANLKVATMNYLESSKADIDFHITGGRKLGADAIDPSKITYNLDADGTTNSSGEKDFDLISPGQYTFSLSSSESNYELIRTDPISPFSLAPDQTLTLKVKLAEKNFASLLVKAVRMEEEKLIPVSGAVVKLSNASGYGAEQTTLADGVAFFPETADLFQSGTYDLKITAEGFQDNNSQVTINENELKIETKELTGL